MESEPEREGERCGVCGLLTAGDRCPRCGRPVCLEHVPSVHELCRDCEAGYHELRGAVGDRLAYWIPFGMVWLVFLLAIPALWSMGVIGAPGRQFSTGIPLVDAFIGAALGSLLLGETARRVRNWIVRRRFLRG